MILPAKIRNALIISLLLAIVIFFVDDSIIGILCLIGIAFIAYYVTFLVYADWEDMSMLEQNLKAELRRARGEREA